MVAQIVGSEFMIIFGGVACALWVLCSERWKVLVRNRIRAYRFGKELSKLNDAEHVEWAAHLVVRWRNPH